MVWFGLVLFGFVSRKKVDYLEMRESAEVTGTRKDLEEFVWRMGSGGCG